MRVCSGTDSNTVLARAIANRTAFTHGNQTLTASGRHTSKPSVVSPSTAMGSPTTCAVRR